MLTTLVAGVVTVTVAALGIVLPQATTKHRREIALLEAETADRLPNGSSQRRHLEFILATRIADWERSHSRRDAERWLIISWLMFATSLALIGVDSAVHYWLDPTDAVADIASAASVFRAVLYSAIVLTGVLTLGAAVVAVRCGIQGLRTARRCAQRGLVPADILDEEAPTGAASLATSSGPSRRT